ncbi:MAG: hypothetical protein LUD50_03670 [Clostridia bacterium]|nr:hypothetical protein [Clostridia bacterium]
MIPEEIERLKPLEFGDVRILESDGRYNVFMDVSQWSRSSRGRSQRVTGICVGSITGEDGFVPNEEGERILASKRTAVVKNMGGYELLRQLCPGLEDRIRKAFPAQYEEILSIALIEAVQVMYSSHELYQDMYEHSVLSEWYPGLDLSMTGSSRVEEQLGHNRKALLVYMNAWLKEVETDEADSDYLLDEARHIRDLCANEEMYEAEMDDMVTDQDFGSLLTDFVKEQYVFTLECVAGHGSDVSNRFFHTTVILKLADLVCLVITPEGGKYMTSVPDQLQEFLDCIRDEHPVTLSINRYLV